MLAILKRCLWIASLGLVVLIAAVLAYYLWKRPSSDVRAFLAIRFAATSANSEFNKAIQEAKSAEAKDQAAAVHAAHLQKLVEGCLELAEEYPGTTGELAALWWASSTASETEAGRKAFSKLKARVGDADLTPLGEAITYAQVISVEIGPLRGIASNLLGRVKESPNHQHAAHLLTEVCVMTAGGTSDETPSEHFSEAADLIASRYAASPDITNFCEVLGMGFGSPSWTTSYERHLRAILDANQDRQVRCAAHFALASVVQSSGESRQMEARKLYEQFLADFNGRQKYRYRNIERQLGELATTQIEELDARAIGKPAPDIVGSDLAGQPMKLSDYRGKVVLLSFWATWCKPCIELIPHERALAARLKNDPFAIVGVNGDTNDASAQLAVATHQIGWPSFRNQRADKRAISDEWQLVGWPTLYLIDREGIVRKRWVGDPSPAELNRAVDQALFTQ